MIVCDEVVLDPVTAKLSIVGVIHEIACRAFPVLYSEVTIWAELSGGRASQVIEFVAVRIGASPDGEVSLAASRTTVTFPNPIKACIVGARLKSLLLTGPGEIVFRMAVGGVVIMERRVRIILRADS